MKLLHALVLIRLLSASATARNCLSNGYIVPTVSLTSKQRTVNLPTYHQNP